MGHLWSVKFALLISSPVLNMDYDVNVKIKNKREKYLYRTKFPFNDLGTPLYISLYTNI